MITYSIIKKSQLEGALRLDAEYYQPDYLVWFKKIERFNNRKIREISKVLRGNTPKGYGDFEIPIVRSGDLSYNFINDNENLLLAKNKDIFYLNNGDILISSIGFGSIGKINIFTGENNKYGTVSEVSVIRNSNINNYFLWAFLSSKFGQFQINREITGATGQLHLNIGNVGNVCVPVIDDKIFENYYKQAEVSYTDSKLFYQQAEKLLLEELGLENFEKETEKSLFNIVNFSDIEKAKRIDAEYFQSKYEKIISVINKNNGEKLGNIVSLKKGFEPGSEEYQEEGKLFIRVSSLSKDGVEEKDQKYLNDELFDKLRKDFQPKIREILLTKDATPGIACVLKENIDGIISSGIVRLIMKDTDIEPEYLALCINSILGQMQTKRDAGGSVIAHWKPEQIKNLLIPILPKNTQEKISELVKKSHKSRKEAQELLEEAKKKVEDLIEK